jgi:hypothetical protein
VSLQGNKLIDDFPASCRDGNQTSRFPREGPKLLQANDIDYRWCAYIFFFDLHHSPNMKLAWTVTAFATNPEFEWLLVAVFHGPYFFKVGVVASDAFSSSIT